MTPSQRYAADLENSEFLDDPAQRRAVAQLDRLYQDLTSRVPARGRSGWLRRLFGAAPPAAAPRGLYLWGDVGRGKSYLMDLLFDALSQGHKRRDHFHAFMQMVHRRLRALKDRTDPVEELAGTLAADLRLLCFDELQVQDVADAMILGPLLNGLMEHGVTIVCTSNTPPRDLYRGGLQRERFVPTIELLCERLVVFELDGGTDYRRRSLADLEHYHMPLGEAAHTALEQAFRVLAGGTERSAELRLGGRPLRTRRLSTDVVWVDFEELCATPRSAADYLELAERFHTLVLSGIPAIPDHDYDVAKRFVHLIDVLYDRRRNLVASAAVPPEQIYGGDRVGFEFRRTVSRLNEMQTTGYLADAPLRAGHAAE